MDELQIIVTSDGSHSLLNTKLNETYHSHHGATQESTHVFIKNGLEFYVGKMKDARQDIRILEVGFGTGLNALLTIGYLLRHPGKNIIYTTIEPFPLPENIWSQLNYPTVPVLQSHFRTLHLSRWDTIVALTANFSLKKVKGLLQSIPLAAGGFDLVYFDAFAPNKQPEIWELSVLEKVVKAMSATGVFVTYSAKGKLKRDLRSLGLDVETLPGPPGKKEMVRGVKRAV